MEKVSGKVGTEKEEDEPEELKVITSEDLKYANVENIRIIVLRCKVILWNS